MSLFTRAAKRILAEGYYMVGNYKKAGQLVTNVAVERLFLAAEKAMKVDFGNRLGIPLEKHIELRALFSGPTQYQMLAADIETKIEPFVEKCKAKGIAMKISGIDYLESVEGEIPSRVIAHFLPTETAAIFV